MEGSHSPQLRCATENGQVPRGLLELVVLLFGVFWGLLELFSRVCVCVCFGLFGVWGLLGCLVWRLKDTAVKGSTILQLSCYRLYIAYWGIIRRASYWGMIFVFRHLLPFAWNSGNLKISHRSHGACPGAPAGCNLQSSSDAEPWRWLCAARRT